MRPDGLATDFHAHLVPGVDDGSRDPVETVAMARGLAALGVRRVHVTPHQFRFGNDFAVRELRDLAEDVRELVARAEIGLEIEAGAEYYYGEQFLDALQRGEELCTFDPGSGEPHLLIELPLRQPARGVRKVGEMLMHRGIRPVMAHPERLVPRLATLGRIRQWAKSGWRLQLNVMSLIGHHGPDAAAAARTLLGEGVVRFAGSDLHRPSELASLRRAHRDFFRAVPTIV